MANALLMNQMIETAINVASGKLHLLASSPLPTNTGTALCTITTKWELCHIRYFANNGYLPASDENIFILYSPLFDTQNDYNMYSIYVKTASTGNILQQQIYIRQKNSYYNMYKNSEIAITFATLYG